MYFKDYEHASIDTVDVVTTVVIVEKTAQINIQVNFINVHDRKKFQKLARKQSTLTNLQQLLHDSLSIATVFLQLSYSHDSGSLINV